MGNCTKCLKPSDSEKEDQLSPVKVPSLDERYSRKMRPKRKLTLSPQTEGCMPDAQLAGKKVKSIPDRKVIREALKTSFVFSSLNEENSEYVIDRMQYYTFGPAQIVFHQGEPGLNFFVIDSGQVEVIVNLEAKCTLDKGKSFGELALLHDSCRTATIKCLTQCGLWGIDRKTFREAVRSVNARNFEENKQFIDNVPTLQKLTGDQKDLLLSVLVTQHFVTGQDIVKEGDPGDLFYIIKEGEVICSVKGRVIRTLYRGEFFGEQALLYNTQRTATVTSSTNTTILSLGRDHLHSVLGDKLTSIIYKNTQRIALENHPYWKSLAHSQVESIIQHMNIQTYYKGQRVISREEEELSLTIILKGGLESTEKKYEVYDCIYQLLSEDIFASERTDIAYISIKQIEDIIGGTIDAVFANNEVFPVLRKMQLFRCLPSNKIREISLVLSFQSFSKNTVLFEEGSEGDAFYIVKEGSVDIVKNSVCLRTIGKHSYFGERSMLLHENRTATVVAREDTVCWTLAKQSFLDLVKEGIRTQLLKRITLQDDSVGLADLRIINSLGKGMFGNVFLTLHKSKGNIYALKSVSRAKISAYELYESINLERHILLQLDHPFIMKLVKTFKDPERVYFLMEYVQGQDLFDVMRTLNLVTNKDSKFYTGCLMLILEHLHEKHIAYRDLKPENIIIDEGGYPKLIDFGSAKIVKGRTHTVVGTPHYMAPEVITGKGYGVESDYWSVGILLYELLSGYVPFGEEEEEPGAIYEKIIEHNLVFPEHFDAPNEAKLLIEQLLNENGGRRGTFSTIKHHVWFNDMNFDDLLGKQVKPPHVPKVKVDNRKKKGKTVLGSIIAREEIKDGVRASSRPEPEGWDSEF